jgi:murein DD-endopeptidase MepM/ murein hydrolase activator NlpD
LNELNGLERAAERIGKYARQHTRGIAAGVSVALAGFAATAFGIAPLAPDAADLPRQLISLTVEPPEFALQLDALADHPLELSRSGVTQRADTVDTLLGRLGVNDIEAAGFLRSDPRTLALLDGHPGKMVRAVARPDGSLVELVARYPATDSQQASSHFTRLTVRRVDGAWHTEVENAALATQVQLGSGTIRSSLFAATDDARIPDAIAVQIAEVFSNDIDFHRELRRDDHFSVVYESLTADGEPITWGHATGRVLAAQFVNDGRTFEAVWFEGANGHSGYFDLDGESRKRAFLASPVEFSRVSSGFGMRRHPILHTLRAHRGVDYAAPTGTPVRTVGDGVVEFAGRQGGYGNVVTVRHANQHSTLYAHLSRIDVKTGQRVEQGQRIGAVGATGWATGPHLHFEFLVNGQHENPLRVVRRAETTPLARADRAEFQGFAQAMRAQLDVAQSIAGTTAFGD